MLHSTISVEDVTSKKISEKQKTRHSNFLITINTNKRPKTQNELVKYVNDLRSYVKNGLLSNYGLTRLLKFKEGNLGDIKNIDAKFAIEMGRHTKGGRVHAHIFLKIDHNAMLDFPNKQFIIDELSRRMGIMSPHIDFKIVGSQKNIEDYLSKYSN